MCKPIRGVDAKVPPAMSTIPGDSMSLDRVILAFAGLMVLLSVVLAVYVSPYWLFLTAFVGLNLLQSAFTGFCPAAMIFKKIGCRSGAAFQ